MLCLALFGILGIGALLLCPTYKTGSAAYTLLLLLLLVHTLGISG
jgi:hypothetical protein